MPHKDGTPTIAEAKATVKDWASQTNKLRHSSGKQYTLGVRAGDHWWLMDDVAFTKEKMKPVDIVQRFHPLP